MRSLVLVWVLGWALTGLEAQTTNALPWIPNPTTGLETARAQEKPVLLLWQAGPGASAFTQGVERLFSSWPGWTTVVFQSVVATRGRSWEAPLPEGYPPLPAMGKKSALVLWSPSSPSPAAIWTEVPPVLEFSRRLAEASGRPLGDPYTIDVVGYRWDDGEVTRVSSGPLWTSSGSAGPFGWVEEAPLGTILVMVEVSTGRRAAFPLEGDWSFLFDPVAQSWSAWKPVVVTRRSSG